MAYCTVQDIRDDFKDIKIDSTSACTDAWVSDVITQESDYIDAKIGLRYVTPIVQATYPQAFNLLRRICIFRVSERVRNKIEIKHNATQQRESDEKFKDNPVRTFNDDLEDIVKSNLGLPGVPTLTQNGLVNSFAVDSGKEAFFKTDKQQW